MKKPKTNRDWLIVIYWMRALREAPLEALEETILMMPFASEFKQALADTEERHGR